ncbi:MAG: hypothetical protein HY822_02165 [Acidobacteria bacterium]|nr:hypothetical protein [Acidobacteriota bacterium]
MTKRRDPIENEIELALRPGAFIRDGACFSFVSGLEEVAARIDALTGTEPARAAGLCETFLAGCYAKAEELDDSSGSFGTFAQDLICRWVKARQTAGADPNETAARILAWMDDDPYAFCYQIEKDAAKALDKAGRAAFEKSVRARFEAAPAQPEYNRRRWSEVLRAIYLARRNAAAYEALAEETGLTAQDCLALAEIFVSRKPDRALAWVERGIDLDRKTPHGTPAGYGLTRLQRELLTKLGRGNEALDAAWAEYRKDPSKYGYDNLLRLAPKAQRAAWHEKAMDAAKGANLHSVMELFVEAKETERLADLVRGTTDGALEAVSHYTTEPAARKLEKKHPGLAARLWRAQAMRIAGAGKSKYYDAAAANLERARKCYFRAGLGAEWEETVRLVRAGHHRKTAFMAAFESVAAGAGHHEQPSFLERAKTRWGGRRGGDRS